MSTTRGGEQSFSDAAGAPRFGAAAYDHAHPRAEVQLVLPHDEEGPTLQNKQ